MVSSQQGYIPTVVDMKADPKQVDEVKSNLPLPEQPPVASDFNSADARTVNVGAGGLEGDISASGHGNETLREPATGSVGAAGREGKDGLGGIPNDAVMDPLKSLIAVLFIFAYPLVWLMLYPLLVLVAVVDRATHARIQASRTRTVRRRRGLKFTCQSPTCGKSSCTNCNSPWSDPHACNEASLQSLRQAIEAATTSSIKRTCPKCNLSFVKSSGCNKLVCNCGYTMCYVCRQEIGREGYGHFCQHFREAGGRCSECDRCDLYIVEDEEGTIRRAAIQAEKDWLEREGKSKDTDDKLGAVVNDVLANATGGKRCDYDAWLDFFMGIVLE